jgi:hypothetical protein
MPQSDELIERVAKAIHLSYPHDIDPRSFERMRKIRVEQAKGAITALQPIDGEVERLLRNPQLPFDIALAVQNSHYVANGVKPLDHLDAFTEQYVKDARTSIETIVSALNRDRLS